MMIGSYEPSGNTFLLEYVATSLLNGKGTAQVNIKTTTIMYTLCVVHEMWQFDKLLLSQQ